MSVIKAFARGFAAGWRSSWTRARVLDFWLGVAQTGAVLIFWEWLNGRLP